MLEPQSMSARSASLEQDFLRSNKQCHMLLPQTSIEQISKHDPGDFPHQHHSTSPSLQPQKQLDRSSGRWCTWQIFASLMIDMEVIGTAFLREEFGNSIVSTMNTELQKNRSVLRGRENGR